MARWAESRDEFEHLRRISEQEHKSTEEGYILGFQLKNGTILSGLVVGSSARNNYGEKGPFKLMQDITIVIPNGEKLSLDFLDIQLIYNNTNKETLEIYRKLGYISDH